MTLSRRRAPENIPTDQSRQRPASPSTGAATRPRLASLYALVPLVSLFALCLRLAVHHIPQAPPIPQSTAPDDETILSTHLLPHDDDSIPENFSEELVACMPTVSRRGAEYVSNAVKSWRLATNASTTMRRLIVFEMDYPISKRMPSWRGRVFRKNVKPGTMASPSWLAVMQRQGTPPETQKLTLGDSVARVQWRSKEAADYGEVLTRCAAEAKGRYVMIVQDDVLFTSAIDSVVSWFDRQIVRLSSIPNGTRRKRMCSVSLFDLSEKDAVDGHEIRSSNMVARVWETERAHRVARFLQSNFDEAPVDWLADRMCRGGRRVTLVMEPNVVRHRGAVSSFSENLREATLT